MTPFSPLQVGPGDVVLVKFPFTDLSSAKQRPAVIVSPAAYSSRFQDVVVIAVTGQRQGEPTFALSEWRAAGLVKPTWFKPLLATLSCGIVVKRLGILAHVDRARLARVLRSMIDDSVWVSPD